MSHRARVAAIVSVGVFVASLDLFIVNIAFPDIQRDFDGTSLASLSWVLNAYAIVFAALLVPAGRWADRTGRKRAFLGGLALFTLASRRVRGGAVGRRAGRGARRPGRGRGDAACRRRWACCCRSSRPRSAGWRSACGRRSAGPRRRPGRSSAGCWWSCPGAGSSWSTSRSASRAIVAGARVLREIRDAGRRAAGPDRRGLLTAARGDADRRDRRGAGLGLGRRARRRRCSRRRSCCRRLRARARHATGAGGRARAAEGPRVRGGQAAGLFFFIGFSAMLLGSVLWLTEVWGENALGAGLKIAPGPAMAALFAVAGGMLSGRIGPRLVGTARRAAVRRWAACGGLTHLGADGALRERLPARDADRRRRRRASSTRRWRARRRRSCRRRGWRPAAPC